MTREPPDVIVIGAGAAGLIAAAELLEELQGYYYHDWQQDPFARGAYSYVTVGASEARTALAAPLVDTLFFAGEATYAEQGGTVAGALESGVRAARELLSSLKNAVPSGARSGRAR